MQNTLVPPGSRRHSAHESKLGSLSAEGNRWQESGIAKTTDYKYVRTYVRTYIVSLFMPEQLCSPWYALEASVILDL